VINSLQGVLNAMVQTGFAVGGSNGTGTLGRAVTYQTFAEPTYDTATGDVTTPSPTEYAVTAILVGYTAREVLPDVVLQTDMKALILKADLPVTPQTRDCLLIGGIPWRVVTVQDDTAQTVWILQVRRESSEGAS
jgi:hypothetical protein